MAGGAMDCHTPEKRPRRAVEEAGDPEAAGMGTWINDKLPGQCHLDGITVLVQDIQARRARRPTCSARP
jgi:hypothetical protein